MVLRMSRRCSRCSHIEEEFQIDPVSLCRTAYYHMTLLFFTAVCSPAPGIKSHAAIGVSGLFSHKHRSLPPILCLNRERALHNLVGIPWILQHCH